jgi:hypothetical protein
MASILKSGDFRLENVAMYIIDFLLICTAIMGIFVDMYIETVPNRNSPACILLRESFRQEGKVKHRTLANLTDWPKRIVAGLGLLLKGHQPSAAVSSESFRITRSLPHGHVEAVLRVVRTLGLDRLLGSKLSRERNLGLAMIVARILDPGSKLATARSLHCQTLSSTLAQECHLEGSIHENELYAAMDWLVSRQARIEKALATRHLEEGCLVLYDLTSSYLEGKCCELGRLGFNRDGKVGKLQIEYGLLCNKEGCPVAVEVFEGNTADPMTLGSQIQKVRERFGLRHVVIVGDRGMITQARIDQELRGIEGLGWIGALRSSQIARLLEEGAIAPSLFDEKNLAEISSPDFPAERLIACRNPLLAQYRRTKREALLRATEVELEKIALATNRQKRPLRGKAKIALRAGRLIERFKVAKHFILEIEQDAFGWNAMRQKLQKKRLWTGCTWYAPASIKVP